jgi:hypothetical protein
VFFADNYIPPMRRFAVLILPVLLLAPLLRSQTPPVAYRGFELAAPYAAFSARARLLADPRATPLVCNTSRRTAQLMECGAPIRDPADSARFYLAAYVLEGRVAFLSFGDSGSPPLVERLQQDLKGRFGRPHASRAGMWEWRTGLEVVRLTWRGRGSARWVYIALWDQPLMNRIARYVPRPRH